MSIIGPIQISIENHFLIMTSLDEYKNWMNQSELRKNDFLKLMTNRFWLWLTG